MWAKIKDVLKKSWGWIKWVLGIAGGAFLAILAMKQISELGKPRNKKNWKPVPGDDTQVLIENDGQWIKRKLPKIIDENGIEKQKKIQDIKIIRLSKKEGVKIEYKHNPINRRTGDNPDSDMSI